MYLELAVLKHTLDMGRSISSGPSIVKFYIFIFLKDWLACLFNNGFLFCEPLLLFTIKYFQEEKKDRKKKHLPYTNTIAIKEHP